MKKRINSSTTPRLEPTKKYHLPYIRGIVTDDTFRDFQPLIKARVFVVLHLRQYDLRSSARLYLSTGAKSIDIKYHSKEHPTTTFLSKRNDRNGGFNVIAEGYIKNEFRIIEQDLGRKYTTTSTCQSGIVTK